MGFMGFIHSWWISLIHCIKGQPAAASACGWGVLFCERILGNVWHHQFMTQSRLSSGTPKIHEEIHGAGNGEKSAIMKYSDSVSSSHRGDDTKEFFAKYIYIYIYTYIWSTLQLSVWLLDKDIQYGLHPSLKPGLAESSQHHRWWFHAPYAAWWRNRTGCSPGGETSMIGFRILKERHFWWKLRYPP